MRYFSLIIFAAFIFFSFNFASQNTDFVMLSYNIKLLNVSYNTKIPIFIIVFFSFSFGIIFSTFYFLFYHLNLKYNLKKKEKEVKHLKSLIELEKAGKNYGNERNLELNKVVKGVQSKLDIQHETKQSKLDIEKSEKLLS